MKKTTILFTRSHCDTVVCRRNAPLSTPIFPTCSLEICEKRRNEKHFESSHHRKVSTRELKTWSLLLLPFVVDSLVPFKRKAAQPRVSGNVCVCVCKGEQQ